jgi:CheY-like chemotaxis protein
MQKYDLLAPRPPLRVWDLYKISSGIRGQGIAYQSLKVILEAPLNDREGKNDINLIISTMRVAQGQVMPKEKVLVVDDEPMIRELLREALECWGYNVSEAGTGAQMLAALSGSPFAAVLLDINLPDSSGLDLLREIKRRWPRVAVIMVSAETFYDTAVSALRGGADDFIGKPIHLDELRFALNHAGSASKKEGELMTVDKPRVLLISDAAERIPSLQTIFSPNEVEFTSAIYPEKWGYVATGKYDLALIDVGSDLLEPLLKTIRTNSTDIPLLVESSRVALASNIAGVLPRYRAMPCGRSEMIRLARRRLAAITSRRRAKSLL